jgi:hypothetical protein
LRFTRAIFFFSFRESRRAHTHKKAIIANNHFLRRRCSFWFVQWPWIYLCVSMYVCVGLYVYFVRLLANVVRLFRISLRRLFPVPVAQHRPIIIHV